MPENIQNLRLELHWGKLKVQKMQIFSEASEEQTIKLPTVHHFIVYSEQLKEKGLNQERVHKRVLRISPID